MEIIANVKNYIPSPFNFFDLLFLVGFIIYILGEAKLGLLTSFYNLVNSVFSFFIGIAFYGKVAKLLSQNFTLSKGFSDAIGFILVGMISWLILGLMLSYLDSLIRKFLLKGKINNLVNFFGGAFFGIFSYSFMASILVLILLSFPISAFIKNEISSSVSGKYLSSKARTLDADIKMVFGGAIEETINFLTVEPKSDEIVKLHFSTSNYKIDQVSEVKMLEMVNKERKKVGINPLSYDSKLSEAARAHGEDMLKRGYFSHYTPEGYSPFDRLKSMGITYSYAGENLAFAPDVNIAMDGLMKSKGHRDNILSSDFNKAGIGVLDAGIYGKMFVQEFSD